MKKKKTLNDIYEGDSTNERELEDFRVCKRCNTLFSCSYRATTRIYCDDCQPIMHAEKRAKWSKDKGYKKQVGRTDGDYIYM